MGTRAELPPPPPTRNTGWGGAGDFDAKGDLKGKAAAAAAGVLAGKGDFAVGVGAVLLAAAGVLGRVGVMCAILTGGRAGDLRADTLA